MYTRHIVMPPNFVLTKKDFEAAPDILFREDLDELVGADMVDDTRFKQTATIDTEGPSVKLLLYID